MSSVPVRPMIMMTIHHALLSGLVPMTMAMTIAISVAMTITDWFSIIPISFRRTTILKYRRQCGRLGGVERGWLHCNSPRAC